MAAPVAALTIHSLLHQDGTVGYVLQPKNVNQIAIQVLWPSYLTCP